MSKMYHKFYLIGVVSLLIVNVLYGQLPPANDYSFYINQFEVKLSASTLVDGQRLVDLVMTLQRNLNRVPTDEEIFQALIDRTLTGPASTKIAGKVANVMLHNVKIKKTRSRPQLPDRIVAVEGYATGRGSGYIEYAIEGFALRLKMSSIKITLDDATAHVQIRIPFRRIGVERDDALVLKSSQADIDPNGAVCGDNFTCTARFKPKDSKYTFHVRPLTLNKVNIGNHQSCSNYISGISLIGTAKRNLVTLSFSAIIRPGIKEIIYKLHLDAPIKLEPECQYFLKLHAGEIVYRYVREGMYWFNPLVLKSCTGSFKADLRLPPSVPTVSGETIELGEIILKTDSSGALFGKAQVPKCRVGSLFEVECLDSNAWIYFDNWTENNRHYACKDTICENVYSLFASRNELCRPGVSILSGRLFFQAPQASVDTLHTLFWGTLTITPMGMTGDLSSSKYSLVPLTDSVKPIENISINLTIDSIIQAQNSIPQKSTLFTLSDLRIIEMCIGHLRFCYNLPDASLIWYNVYFPYPAHINIDFIDSTLDEHGYFHYGYGPVSTKGYTLTTNPGVTTNTEATTNTLALTAGGPYLHDALVMLIPDPSYGAVGSILWFWRLPISLYRLGTEVKHKVSRNEKTKIHINVADLGILPLSSTDSLRIGGVPVTAKLNTEGGFVLIDHDTINWFGKFGLHNFTCVLDSIRLAALTELPNDRDYDLKWWGIIDFPFFDSTEVNFFVRNVIPNLQTPLFTDTVRSHVAIAHESLYVKADSIEYSYDKSRFLSEKAMCKRHGDGQYTSARLIIESIVYAYAVLDEAPPPETLDISTNKTETDCGRPRTVIARMKDATLSDYEFDLVCYDEEAFVYRDPEDEDICSQDFYRGTYEVVSISDNNDTITILSVPNTKYYHLMNPPMLDANNSDAVFQSDEYTTSEPIEIYVPGMRLYIDGDIVRGTIDTKPNIGVEIPIDVGLYVDFYLNTKCGWFYLYTEAGFVYIVEMDGELLVAHCPMSECMDPITRLAYKASMSADEFIDHCLFPSPSNKKVLTCVVISGGWGPDWGIIKVRLGGGFYYAQQQSSLELGGYWIALGEVDLILGSCGVYGVLKASWTMPGHKIELHGLITGKACADAKIGHCSIKVTVEATFRSDGEVTQGGAGVSTDCGWGGCP